MTKAARVAKAAQGRARVARARDEYGRARERAPGPEDSLLVHREFTCTMSMPDLGFLARRRCAMELGAKNVQPQHSTTTPRTHGRLTKQ
jgi:hypothetical protein